MNEQTTKQIETPSPEVARYLKIVQQELKEVNLSKAGDKYDFYGEPEILTSSCTKYLYVAMKAFPHPFIIGPGDKIRIAENENTFIIISLFIKGRRAVVLCMPEVAKETWMEFDLAEITGRIGFTESAEDYARASRIYEYYITNKVICKKRNF